MAATDMSEVWRKLRRENPDLPHQALIEAFTVKLIELSLEQAAWLPKPSSQKPCTCVLAQVDDLDNRVTSLENKGMDMSAEIEALLKRL